MKPALPATASASPSEVAPRPKHWARVVLYAYLRMMGHTQKHAAHAVQRSERRAQEWEENRGLYAQAREEARQRWLSEATDAARQTLLASIRDGAGDLALKLLERIDPDLAPAKQTSEQPLLDIHLHVETARDRLADRIALLAVRHAEDASNGQ
jgi:hypothetical protein